MVVEYIRYTIDEGKAEEFEHAYRRAGGALQASEHCERYEVSRCNEDPTQRVVRIEWDSEEGHMSGFRQSPEFRSFFEAGRAIRPRHRRDAPLPGDAREQRPLNGMVLERPRQTTFVQSESITS